MIFCLIFVCFPYSVQRKYYLTEICISRDNFLMERKASFPFAFPSFYRNSANKFAKLLALGRKKERVLFVLLSFYRNFAKEFAI